MRDPDLSRLETGNIEKKLKELAQNGFFCLVECAIEPCCSIFRFHFSQNPQPVAGDDLLTPLSRRRGLPIGNLTSQFFGNVYLNGFDHFVKEQLKIRKYLRYVDDFALFSDDRGVLVEARQKIEAYLAKLRLKVNPIKSQLFATQHGANFLGFRILPDRIRVRTENLRFGRRRIRQLQSEYASGKIEIEKVSQSLQSWQAHLAHGDTWHLCQQIFAPLVFARE